LRRSCPSHYQPTHHPHPTRLSTSLPLIASFGARVGDNGPNPCSRASAPTKLEVDCRTWSPDHSSCTALATLSMYFIKATQSQLLDLDLGTGLNLCFICTCLLLCHVLLALFLYLLMLLRSVNSHGRSHISMSCLFNRYKGGPLGKRPCIRLLLSAERGGDHHFDLSSSM
jgi:hypothetical protein